MTPPPVAESKYTSRVVWSIACPRCKQTAPLKGFFADMGVTPSPGNYTCFYCKNIVFVNEFLDPACKEEE